MNSRKEIEISIKISLLLNASARPLNVSEIALFLGDSYAYINLSLARLLREGTVKIESIKGSNYFSRSLENCIFSQDQIVSTTTLN